MKIHNLFKVTLCGNKNCGSCPDVEIKDDGNVHITDDWGAQISMKQSTFMSLGEPQDIRSNGLIYLKGDNGGEIKMTQEHYDEVAAAQVHFGG